MTTIMTTGTTDISSVLIELGVDVKRVGEREISGRCPVHIKRTGHEDRSPSWSMNAETGLWICYSCGARGTLTSLISEITGSDQSIIDVHKLIIQSTLNRVTAGPKEEQTPDIDWISYGKFKEVPSNLLELRNLDPYIARFYGIKWDTNNKCWVIPIVSPAGELLGWQSKKKGWVRNYPVGIKKSETLFGIERFTSKTAVLLESPLDVVRLGTLVEGVQGLATFGAYVSKQQLNLLSMVANRVIVAMDNDEAGKQANKAIRASLPRFTGGVAWINYNGTSAKDIGDMTDSEIIEAINTSSAIPGWR